MNLIFRSFRCIRVMRDTAFGDTESRIRLLQFVISNLRVPATRGSLKATGGTQHRLAARQNSTASETAHAMQSGQTQGAWREPADEARVEGGRRKREAPTAFKNI